MFTNEQISEIAGRLAALGVSDSRFAWSSPLLGDETVVVVQDGGERRVTVRELYDTFRDSMYYELALQLWTSCWALYGDELFGRVEESAAGLEAAAADLTSAAESLGAADTELDGLTDVQKAVADLEEKLKAEIESLGKILS